MLSTHAALAVDTREQVPSVRARGRGIHDRRLWLVPPPEIARVDPRGHAWRELSLGCERSDLLWRRHQSLGAMTRPRSLVQSRG